ncbi:glycosyltransferase [Geodermatophilus sp. Leaf369]|uniref:glycosyltransferase n=1 Tax=Geodermatophilus sp. Leaf369 TaxID=1736354 RepID=UPI000AD866D6|nr:glycosyltransferase [Geodermatophilus sp. Leaf369]
MSENPVSQQQDPLSTTRPASEGRGRRSSGLATLPRPRRSTRLHTVSSLPVAPAEPGRRLRIALIASSRFPIAEPFAGGLEAHVWQLTRSLAARGHDVTLFAGPGSDPSLGAESLPVRTVEVSPAARADVSMGPEVFLEDHHAYLSLMMELTGARAHDFDLVHNHSLHYLPIAMAPALRVPMVSTLHCPPTPWLESALQSGTPSPVHLVAVSGHTARAWSGVAGVRQPVGVVPNGVDLTRWVAGPGGGPLIWSGRIVPEKGTHLAVQAALAAGRELQIAGPVIDHGYFERTIEPFLGLGVTHLGHLGQDELAAAVGRASVALVTPCWDEPYGLVVAEALACGTPVVAFARGGIPEVLTPAVGRLVPAGDVAALAAAIPEAEGLSRAAARERARTHCSVDTMVTRYEQLYASLVSAGVTAAP